MTIEIEKLGSSHEVYKLELPKFMNLVLNNVIIHQYMRRNLLKQKR